MPRRVPDIMIKYLVTCIPRWLKKKRVRKWIFAQNRSSKMLLPIVKFDPINISIYRSYQQVHFTKPFSLGTLLPWSCVRFNRLHVVAVYIYSPPTSVRIQVKIHDFHLALHNFSNPYLALCKYLYAHIRTNFHAVKIRIFLWKISQAEIV